MNIELCDFVGRSRPRVFQVDAHVDGFSGFALSPAQLEIRKCELRITQPITKRIERRALFIPVTLGLIPWILRGVVRVVDGDLPGVPRPGEWKLAAGYGIAKKKICDGVAALRAGIPNIENGGNVSGGPFNVERASVEKNENDGLAGRRDGF